ncbi:MAG: MFS transporter [Actinomycetota bacterium]|nr:MFS transporter [Actinomycetota bacterium]
MTSEHVQRVYFWLLLLQTLAVSLIWGVNTLFLLDAGLSITEAFVANGAFTAGMVLFEVPTGVVADAAGRRVSFILGAVTLLVTTVGYFGLWFVEAGVWWWILVSVLIGLGFTFFSGATEAWLVDALEATGFDGPIEHVFGRGQTVIGVATLFGTIGGGFLAQISLGVPYIARSAILVVVIAAAFIWMHDIGHTPKRGIPIREGVRTILKNSIEHGLKNPPVRMFMFGAPFAAGVYIWVFYAFQPYLLELFGDPNAIYLSGIAAGVFSIAQIMGGSAVMRARRLFKKRTGLIAGEVVIGATALVGVGLADRLPIPVGFWVAILLLTAMATLWSLSTPMQQAYMNAVIPSENRATVLSFASLMGNAGGVISQPALGKVADVYSFGVGYIVAGVVFVLRFPFVLAIRRMDLDADQIENQLNA